MQLESLKEKLGDEMFAELESYVSDLTGQRDAARNESINGRKSLKEKVSTYENQLAEIMDRLGLESFDDLENLPDPKNAIEANQQYEARLKRMERQLNETAAAKEQAENKYRDALRKSVVTDALAGHEFLAGDVVSTYIGNRLVWEDDELLFKQDDGTMVSVKDGVAAFAKSRPELLKSTGAGGAGVRSNNARGGQEQQTMTRAEFESLSPAKQMEVAKSGVTLQ